MENDRRDFFKTVGAVAAGAMMATPRAAEAAVAADKYVPAYRHALLLGGAAPEEILSFDGGGLRGIVIKSAQSQPDGVVEKHLATFGYEDVTIALGASQSPGLYAWIEALLNRTFPRRDGIIVAADGQGNPRSQYEFFGAAITELAFPALDSRSRAPAQISLTFLPNRVRVNQTLTATAKIAGAKQKAWQVSNFRLKLNGLEDSCARVTKIDAFTVKQATVPPPAGRPDDPPTVLPVDVSDLVVYCPEEFADQFRAWEYDFLINGNRSSAFEKYGTLEFLAPDKKTVYFTLTLSGLGIFGCGLEGDDMKTSINRNVKVEMYCETVSFTVGAIVST